MYSDLRFIDSEINPMGYEIQIGWVSVAISKDATTKLDKSVALYKNAIDKYLLSVVRFLLATA